MVVYFNSEGQKVWWGKGYTLGGIIVGVGITALGAAVLGSSLTDLIEKYRENHISIREAQRLFVEGGLSLYAMYFGMEAIPRKWEEFQRIRLFEQQQGRKIQGEDYPQIYPHQI